MAAGMLQRCSYFGRCLLKQRGTVEEKHPESPPPFYSLLPVSPIGQTQLKVSSLLLGISFSGVSTLQHQAEEGNGRESV